MTAIAAVRGNGIGDLVDPKVPPVEVIETIQDSTKNTDPAGRHVSEDDWVYPYPTDFKLSEHPIDDIRKLKVDLTKVSCQYPCLTINRWLSLELALLVSLPALCYPRKSLAFN